MDPDEESRAVVQLIFDKFQALGSAWRVFQYLAKNEIQLGFRLQRGANRGQLEWRDSTPSRILWILHHPIYAGAYAYGMHSNEHLFLPLNEMRVLIQDRFPAYISWDEYLGNQDRLQENRSTKTTPGTARKGVALLAGLVRCVRCGYQMRTRHKKRNRCFYLCDTQQRKGEKQTCYGLSAFELDRLVTEKVLQALEPASIELSLRAAGDILHERNRLHEHWQRRLEQARYDAQRIERQYQATEPENRRVARTLESRWEKALQDEQELQENYHRFLQQAPLGLNEDDRSKLQSMCEDIRLLFHAAETSAADRKEIIRCLVERIDLLVEPQSEYVDVTIHWHGGFVSQHEIARPVGSYRQLRDYDRLVERIEQAYEEGATISEIAVKLNEEGFVPPRRRGEYNVGSLATLMQRLGLTRKVQEMQRPGEDEWWVRDLASSLDIIPQKVYYWIKQGWINARRSPSRKHWIVWADPDEMDRLSRLNQQNSSWTADRVPELVTPKPRKT